MVVTINLIGCHRVIGQDSDRKRKMFRFPQAKLPRCDLLDQKIIGCLNQTLTQTCEADTHSITQNGCFKFRSEQSPPLCFWQTQVTRMKRASCVKKQLHHLNACSPSIGFANKLFSQGLAWHKVNRCQEDVQAVGKQKQERVIMDIGPNWVS